MERLGGRADLCAWANLVLHSTFNTEHSTFNISSLRGMCATEEIQHRHPYRDAVRDLFEDHRAARIIGDVAGDLHPSVHRPGMHDDRFAVGAREPLGGEAEGVV